MELKDILAKCDHTLLTQTATWAEIKGVCDDGIKYHTASVCIPASYVKQAKEYVGDKLPICTVIGFPNGYDTTAAKCFMASDAVANGADEVDMVINIGALKSGDLGLLESDIRGVVEAAAGTLVKGIIECCYLTNDEKTLACKACVNAGADYVKTSTGFGTGGATVADVRLMKASIPDTMKVKAAGGISSLQDAEDFLALGADRLGTSRIVKLVKGQQGEGY